MRNDLVVVHWADRCAFAELPNAAPAGSIWLTESGPVRVTPRGRVERLGRA